MSRPDFTFNRWHQHFNIGLLAIFLSSLASMSHGQTLTPTIDFQSQVRPILADHCFACHGPDAQHREAELRFDQLSDAIGEEGVIVPGNLNDSLFWNRVSTTEGDLQMPPPEFKKPLDEKQLKILKQWIQQGAEYSNHWAFQKPVKTAPPAVSRDAWQSNPIDAFLLHEMEKHGLSPNPPADPATLIRRLSLDLNGLPPTVQQVEAFVNNPTPAAYEAMVQQLLSSPRFGERMAVNWLDQARYADTNGYSIDGGRNMWLWRDWVIRSFNENLPYDEFIIQQLAGDLLPNATELQKIATGYNRNHSITHEGGTIPQENLVNYVADRVKTTGETMLGLTMACGQCHDHKFDPITQRDYYQFFAYFNTLDDRGLDGDGGRNSAPAMDAEWVLPGRENEIKQLQSELELLNQRRIQSLDSQKEWEANARKETARLGDQLELFPLEILKVTEPNRGDPYDVDSEGIVWVPSPSGRSPSFSARLPVDQLAGKPVTGIRVQFLPDPRLPHQGLGHGNHPQLPGNFQLTSFSCSTTQLPSDQVDLYRQIPLRQATASSHHATSTADLSLDPRDHNGWSPGNTQTPQHITFQFQDALEAQANPFVTCMLVFGGGYQLVPGKYRFYAITGNDDGTNLPQSVQEILQIEDDRRTTEQQTALREYYSTVAPELAQVRADILTLQQRLSDLQSRHSTMITNTSEHPRATHILNRGQYDQPGEQVEPGPPAALPSLGQFRKDRLGLAQWLTHPDHPLTSRVAVNRFWQHFFGRGLVHPTADFGLQGSPPTHPQLLDNLALHFQESGWDVKDLIHLIVTSQAYRQSSHVSSQALKADPLNQWLARAPRFRLPAEVIRDNALFYGGLLVERQGGRPVFPYQPPGLWREVSHFGSTPATAQVFVQDQGENLYRRSLYTYWKRTVPPPSMQTFDAPNREICTMDRPSTNTPLQALVLLNDVQYVEAARALAERILEQDLDPTQQIIWAFQTVTSRRPSELETQKLLTILQREQQRFENQSQAAQQLIKVGDSLPQSDQPAAQLAAWTTVSQLLLNLSETLTRH